MSGDNIKDLPNSDTPLSDSEKSIMNSLFVTRFDYVSYVIEPLLAFAMFIVLNIPFTDRLLDKIVPESNYSLYIKLVLKALVFTLVLFTARVLFNKFLKK